MKKAILILFILHFATLFWYIFAKNKGISYPVALTRYAVPFPQEWEMFAPPPTHNTHLYYRFFSYQKTGRVDTTPFKAILAPLYKRQHTDRYSFARMSYYLYNCTQNIYMNYVYWQEHLPDSLRTAPKDTITQYIHEKMKQSYSEKSFQWHAQKIFEHQYLTTEVDSVCFVYSIFTETIPPCPFARRETEDTTGTSIHKTLWEGLPARIF